MAPAPPLFFLRRHHQNADQEPHDERDARNEKHRPGRDRQRAAPASSPNS